MFDGIKLLCLGAKGKERPWIKCLNSVIVPCEKFFKIANSPFICPKCRHKSEKVGDYFQQILNLQKAVRQFDKESSFYLGKYGLFYADTCQKDEPYDTAHFLEKNDWNDWNNQIASVILYLTEGPGCRFDLWEDHFYKSRPFLHPKDTGDLTFNSVLRRKTLYYMGHKINNLSLLKNVIKEIRSYNTAWFSLLESHVNAAPVDLKHPLYLALSKGVKTLAEFFPEEIYE